LSLIYNEPLSIRCYMTSMNHLSLKNTGSPQEPQESVKRGREDEVMTELVRDFLDPAQFYQAVKNIGVDFFCGVPDSLLKDFCAYVTANTSKEHHIITANEGNAVALAAGYHLATGKYGMVYLQNSGLGNIVSPVLSLAVPEVYSVPLLLLIGWRGEPGKKDEPQHQVQGKASQKTLDAIGVPYSILPDYIEGAQQVLSSAKQHLETVKGPYALLVKRQTFLPYKLPPDASDIFPLNREEALKVIVNALGEMDVTVGTTGMLSRELFEYREAKHQGHGRDFLTVGSMGHASAIALGIAVNKPERQVYCLDGDGAAIMHMGTMATIGQNGTTNLKHIIINNGAHDSVGGQPTDAGHHDTFFFTQIAKGCGYKEAWVATSEDDIRSGILKMKDMAGPVLMEVKVNKGARKNLGRPTTTPLENKKEFMANLEKPS
ncbi:uncharacterized protein LOC106157387, partial [Lingula anatina]|uniref:2-hydroxyacyl-CoA lyase 2 n=1 Tax=Lingula anatina TaxID=7574 RepID=A0A1S3HR11_LINAN